MPIPQTQVLNQAPFDWRNLRAARLGHRLAFPQRSGVCIFWAVDLAIKGGGLSPAFGRG